MLCSIFALLGQRSLTTQDIVLEMTIYAFI